MSGLMLRGHCDVEFLYPCGSGSLLKRLIHSQLNWTILLYDVIPDGKTAQFWQALAQASELYFPVVFHTELRSSLSESHSFLVLPADTTIASPQGTSVSSIHWADEHRMIYSFLNTTSYSKFYAFFSSFRITLLPMWLANSKRQPCLYPP